MEGVTVAPSPAHGRHVLRDAAFLLLAVAVLVAVLAHYGVFSGSTSSGLQGSGVAAAQARSLPPFHAVELAGSNDVRVSVGGRQTVVVRGDDNLLAHVTTTVRGGRLVVGTVGSFTTRSPMRVDVVVPQLDALRLSGSGVVDAQDVDVPDLTVTLAGSGLMTASGTVGGLDVVLSGSGSARLEHLLAHDANALVSGSGAIFVSASHELDATVTGSGSIVYSGSPRLTEHLSGTGAVVRG